MNLRESLRAAAREAPLSESTVDIGRIVAREHRARTARRVAAGALAGVAAVALSLPLWYPGRHHPGPPLGVAASRAPSAAASPAPTPATTPYRLTAKDFDAATLPKQGSIIGAMRPRPGQGLILVSWADAAGELARGGNPCELAAGATPGVADAPTPEDTCAPVRVGGHPGWIRRWGYSPVYRPWTTPDSVVVQAFVRIGAGSRVLTLANVALDPAAATGHDLGAPFVISDEDIVAIAVQLSEARTR